MGSRLLNIQRRAAEHGRLRTGYTQGNRPVRSRTWIITSHSEEHVRAAAALWGGTVEQWSPLNSTIEQWKVTTEAESIEALLTPGDPLSQYNEMWSKGGCARRCDGQTEQLSRKACMCLAQFGEDWHQQPKGRVCSATSRLNVMLPDLTGLGLWRAETHSFYAASEWGGMVDMVLAGTNGKGFVPVTLRIEPRQRVANGETKKFPVVVVELRGVTPRQALAGPLSTTVALNPGGASAALAIEAPKRTDWIALAQGALTSDDVRDLWKQARDAGDLDPKGSDPLSKQMTQIAALKDEEHAASRQSRPQAAAVDEDGAIEAEVVEEDPTEAWVQIVTAARSRGWSAGQVEERFAEFSGGTMPGSAGTAELHQFLAHMKRGGQ